MFNGSAIAQDQSDLTSWELLASVEWEIDYENGLYKAKFDEGIEELDQQDVTIRGYLYPLGFGAFSSEFLLTPYPINGCFYCVPGSSETMVYIPEIDLREIPYEEVNLTGKFSLVRDSPYGLIYEMKEVSIED
jgi:hypothetical protein